MASWDTSAPETPRRSWARRSRARGSLSALTALLAALLALGLLPATAQAASGSDFVSRINSERSSRGAAPLTVRGDLVAAAQAQAQRMADKSQLFHNPNLAGSVSHWSLLGENVGYGPDTAAVHRAFMNSAPHRANILNARYTEVGVGVVVRDDVVWVAEVFRRPTGAGGSGSTSAGGHRSTTTKHPSTSGSTKSGNQSADPGRAAAQKKPVKHPRPTLAHPKVVPHPSARAVRLAATAERSLPGVRVDVVPVAAIAPLPAEDDSSTPALLALGLLAAVTLGAAVRFRLS